MEFTSRQLRAFHLVARHQSFARAAEELLITPSGLSVLIRELERQLGFRLFDRTTRTVALTAFGSELLAVTEPGLGTLDDAMSRIENSAKGREQSISIGTTPWLAANVVAPAIRPFRERRPHLRIHLFDGLLEEIEQRVQNGDLDMGGWNLQELAGCAETSILPFRAHDDLSGSRSRDQESRDTVVLCKRTESNLINKGLSSSADDR
jgi:DNA-binding transcriptional LysR family regulator